MVFRWLGTLVVGAALHSSSCAPLVLDAAQVERLRVFDRYWGALKEDHPFFHLARSTPEDIGRRYRAAAAYAESDLDLYHIIAGMLSELDDPHASITPRPETELAWPAGLGLIDLQGRSYVLTWPSGEAPRPPDGLEDGGELLPEMVALEGIPAATPSLREMLILTGSPGSLVELDLRWSNGNVTRHYVTRTQAFILEGDDEAAPNQVPTSEESDAADESLEGPSHPFVTYAQRQLSDEASVALSRGADLPVFVLRLTDFSVDTDERESYIRAVEAAIEKARQLDAKEIVLDLRSNPGGSSDLARRVIAHFISEGVMELWDVGALRRDFNPFHRAFSYFALPDGRYLQIVLQPTEVNWDRGLYILVDRNTGSAAEDLALTLQRAGRGVVVGEATAGAEAAVRQVHGGDGSSIQLSRMRQIDRFGRGLQSVGVVPQHSVHLDAADLRATYVRLTEDERSTFLEAVKVAETAWRDELEWELVSKVIVQDRVRASAEVTAEPALQMAVERVQIP